MCRYYDKGGQVSESGVMRERMKSRHRNELLLLFSILKLSQVGHDKTRND
jgi:hypothetical protein